MGNLLVDTGHEKMMMKMKYVYGVQFILNITACQ